MSPILLIVWAVLAACFFALLVYRGQLTRYEDEQLFLNDDANQIEKEQQTDIVRRVNRLKPIITACGGAVGVMTASVVGIYVWNAWKSLQ
jgi:hypothetical protein